MVWVFRLVLLVVSLLTAGFVALNTQNIQLDYYFDTWMTSLPIALGAALLLGVLLTLLCLSSMVIKTKHKAASLRRELKQVKRNAI